MRKLRTLLNCSRSSGGSLWLLLEGLLLLLNLLDPGVVVSSESSSSHWRSSLSSRNSRWNKSSSRLRSLLSRLRQTILGLVEAKETEGIQRILSSLVVSRAQEWLEWIEKLRLLLLLLLVVKGLLLGLLSIVIVLRLAEILEAIVLSWLLIVSVELTLVFGKRLG